MSSFSTKPTPKEPNYVAPDGSEVRRLAELDSCSMAEFRLAAGKISNAFEHRTVEEIWYVVSGSGEMWRSQEGREDVVPLSPGVSLTIPVGTRFQFRATGDGSLVVVGVTVPPWPETGEEAQSREGAWSKE